jgi:hypothetical protein
LAHEVGGKVVIPYAPASFTPRNILVLIFRGSVDLGHMDLSDASGKIPSDTTGDRYRDLPTTTLPQDLDKYKGNTILVNEAEERHGEKESPRNSLYAKGINK